MVQEPWDARSGGGHARALGQMHGWCVWGVGEGDHGQGQRGNRLDPVRSLGFHLDFRIFSEWITRRVSAEEMLTAFYFRRVTLAALFLHLYHTLYNTLWDVSWPVCWVTCRVVFSILYNVGTLQSIEYTRRGKDGGTRTSREAVTIIHGSDGGCWVQSSCTVYSLSISVGSHFALFLPTLPPEMVTFMSCIPWLPCCLARVWLWLQEDKDRDRRSRKRVWAGGDCVSPLRTTALLGSPPSAVAPAVQHLLLHLPFAT